VEALHHAVLDIPDPGEVLPSLGDTVQLLLGLLDDLNFKVGRASGGASSPLQNRGQAASVRARCYPRPPPPSPPCPSPP
jgi:hypothetical protein